MFLFPKNLPFNVFPSNDLQPSLLVFHLKNLMEVFLIHIKAEYQLFFMVKKWVKKGKIEIDLKFKLHKLHKEK